MKTRPPVRISRCVLDKQVGHYFAFTLPKTQFRLYWFSDKPPFFKKNWEFQVRERVYRGIYVTRTAYPERLTVPTK